MTHSTIREAGDKDLEHETLEQQREKEPVPRFVEKERGRDAFSSVTDIEVDF